MISISALSQQKLNWKDLPGERVNGESGYYVSKIYTENGINLRVVEYSRNYTADHWCLKGHFVYVVEGSIVVEHSDNSTVTLNADSSYIVASDTMPHRVRSEDGAKVFIVD